MTRARASASSISRECTREIGLSAARARDIGCDVRLGINFPEMPTSACTHSRETYCTDLPFARATNQRRDSLDARVLECIRIRQDPKGLRPLPLPLPRSFRLRSYAAGIPGAANWRDFRKLEIRDMNRCC